MSCPFVPSSASSTPSRPWKAPASSCTAPSASARPASSIRSCCSTISATRTRTTTSPASPGIPHRGIETITYVLAGTVEHGDSLGNRGKLGAGDVQWMTAGSGIMHQEMPQGDDRGPHARLPALGQPAVVAEDDGAALPGHPGGRHSRDRRRRRHGGARRRRRLLGQEAARSKASPPIRATSTCRCRPASKQDPAGRDHPPRLRLCLRRLRHLPRRLAARSAC